MATTKPAQTAARQLKENLSIRLGALWTIVETVDASGNPVLKVSLTADGAWTTAEEYAYIRVKPVATTNVDSLGLAQTVFCPHVIQIAVEESAAADIAYLTAPRFGIILAECLARGMAVEWYHSANTVEPVVGTIAEANLQFRFRNLWQGITNQI